MVTEALMSTSIRIAVCETVKGTFKLAAIFYFNFNSPGSVEKHDRRCMQSMDSVRKFVCFSIRLEFLNLNKKTKVTFKHLCTVREGLTNHITFR